MVIKISNGEVKIKEFCSRKLKKEINKLMFKGYNVDQNGKANIDFSAETLEKSNDVAMLGLIESIIIKGEAKQVSIETLDSMDYADVDLIINEINKITSKTVPLDKKT